MLTLETWRARILEWLPASALPAHPELGHRYPWRELALHSLSRQHRARVDAARRVIDDAPEPEGLGWYLAISGGKDSVALATLLAEQGRLLPAMCTLRTSVDFPAKDQYVHEVCAALGHEPHLLYPERDDDALAELVGMGIGLADDPGRIGAAMVEAGLWGRVGDWLGRYDFAGVFLGLRAGESRGRKMNRRMRGRVYDRRDGMRVCTPIADWSAWDVHAFLLSRDVPVLPLYLCVDPGDDGMLLREDSFLSGGWAANLGSYAWLRRWWPEQWDRVVAADPTISTLG